MGANPNLADYDGNNGLHHVCKMGEGNDGLADMIFGNDDYKPLPISARNDKDYTPLHLAVKREASNMIEVLLRHGAYSNATNDKGMTPLHYICKKYDDPTLLNLFLGINEELGQPVLIDALDNNGRTPLAWALASHNIRSAEVLLRRGADTILGTPLNRICYYGDRWVELFFEVIDGRNHVVD
ncbi:ankyrin-3-like [Trichogramma pretiosum]|uniref:ankyrin-3-like n=1 Tax=Trichogramma pretiosum TaxID=7493 RepID=UPI0006C9CC4C|nr:ankyrin-3-like [Trichogramma pretiosum]